MTYNRMQAKPIPGKHCHLCKETGLPLVKTECCHEWVCCDTEYLSYRGGGRCQFEHEYYSACHFHFNEKNNGKWQECDECRDFFGEDEFQWEIKKWISSAESK